MKKLTILAVMFLLLVSCQKDDETVVPQCNEPINLSVNNVTFNSAVLSWENSNSSQPQQYKVEYGISGFVLGSGTISTVSSSTLNINNLLPNTTYDFYVQAICSTNNTSISSDVETFTTLGPPVIPEFRQNLSELNLFQGTLSDLEPSIYTFEYHLNTSLYSDYALKQRIVALPPGETMDFVNDGLPNFPDNTVIAKTFYYNLNDGDLSAGQRIIETRVMIKVNGTWEFGDYVWNASQTEAVLDNEGSTVPVTWTDINGIEKTVDYEIPSAENCFTCHQSYNQSTLIGPKLRSMNFNIAGVNQLQKFITEGHLTNVSDVSSIASLPNWEDTSLTPERRVRAYFDMNCAHCHSPGGYHTANFFDALNVAYETSFEDSHIQQQANSMIPRLTTSIEQYSMPFLGVTTPHQEALDLIIPYLESLE